MRITDRQIDIIIFNTFVRRIRRVIRIRKRLFTSVWNTCDRGKSCSSVAIASL